jgi:hypothetical protein
MFDHDWEPATAKIVAKKYKEESGYSGVWEYVADITLNTGVIFRAQLDQPHLMSHVVRLNEGEQFAVLADAKHEKAKFDRSDPRVSGKGTPAAKETFKEALSKPPGSTPSGSRPV